MRTTQTDKHMDELMGLLLRTGVLLAACIVLLARGSDLSRRAPLSERLSRFSGRAGAPSRDFGDS